MRASDKIALIDRIGRELQSRFRFDEIDAFLSEHNISRPEGAFNSKWVYSKVALQGVPTDVILKVAEELDVEIPRATTAAAIPPRNWKDTNNFRLFVSHISEHKDKATRLKSCLATYAINAFVAHEDVHPTLEWQKEIERALYAMDAMLAIHTPGFSKSTWTQQEVGFALGRGVKIISFKMGEDPTGFISKHQALARRGRTAEEIAKEVDTILGQDPLTKSKLDAAKAAIGIAQAADEIPF